MDVCAEQLAVPRQGELIRLESLWGPKAPKQSKDKKTARAPTQHSPLLASVVLIIVIENKKSSRRCTPPQGREKQGSKRRHQNRTIWGPKPEGHQNQNMSISSPQRDTQTEQTTSYRGQARQKQEALQSWGGAQSGVEGPMGRPAP